MRSLAFGSGHAAMETLMLIEATLECVTHGVGRVVMWHGLKLPTGTLALRLPEKYSPISAGVCALIGVTWLELQSNLYMAAIFAGLRGAQESQAAN